jgi:Spy/CpxP family protein refolding chaperone
MSLDSNERAIEDASARSASKKYANCPSVPMESFHDDRVLFEGTHDMLRTARVLLAASLCSLVMASTATPSIAQQPPAPPGEGGGGRGFGGGGGMFGQGMGPAVTSREMEQYVQFLGLDADQKSAAMSLFEAFQQESEEASRTMRDRMQELRQQAMDEGMEGGGGWQRFGEEMRKFRTGHQQAETKFFEDVKTILTPEQAAKFPELERDRRRDRTMQRGLLSGERVDVVRLVEALQLTPEQKAPLGATLDQYKQELDRELIARNAFQDEAMTKMAELFRSDDPDAMEKLWEDGRKVADRVREVNKRYAREVEALLPADKQASFNEGVQRESFPMIYRQSYSSRAVQAAMEFADLDENQKTALTALQESHTREIAALNKKIQTAWEDREKTIKPSDMMRGGFGGGGFGGGRGGGGGMGGFEDDTIRDLRRERRELEDAGLEKLQALLTPEQVAKLPEREGRGQRGEGGERRRGRDGQQEGGGGDARPDQPGQAPNRRV